MFLPKAWGGINYWIRNPINPILSTRFSPKRYSDDVVSLLQRSLMSSFRTCFKRSFRSFYICLCALPSNVIDSTVYPISCLRWSDLDSALAVSISSAIFSTTVVANVRGFWILDNRLSVLLWKGRILLFLATASFSKGTLKTVQLLGTFSPSIILLTTAGFLASSAQYLCHLSQLAGYGRSNFFFAHLLFINFIKNTHLLCTFFVLMSCITYLPTFSFPCWEESIHITIPAAPITPFLGMVFLIWGVFINFWLWSINWKISQISSDGSAISGLDRISVVNKPF